MNKTVSTLVASTNRGRYALDDPEHGHDLTSGEHIALLLGGQWIEGHLAHSRSYDEPGCYTIADAGRSKAAARPHLSKEQFEASMQTARQRGQSLADALTSVSGQVADVFCGYYFIATDGSVCGLCTGMQIRLL